MNMLTACCIGQRRGIDCWESPICECPSGAAFICENHIAAHPEVPDECEKCRASLVAQIEQLVSEGVSATKAREIVQNASSKAPA